MCVLLCHCARSALPRWKCISAHNTQHTQRTQVGIRITDDEADLLAEKFHHDDLPEVRVRSCACVFVRGL